MIIAGSCVVVSSTSLVSTVVDAVSRAVSVKFFSEVVVDGVVVGEVGDGWVVFGEFVVGGAVTGIVVVGEVFVGLVVFNAVVDDLIDVVACVVVTFTGVVVLVDAVDSVDISLVPVEAGASALAVVVGIVPLQG